MVGDHIPSIRATGDLIPIQASPAMYWNDAKREWQIAGLCDACRQPYHGDVKETTIKVFDGPMMFTEKKLSICSDQIKCQQAFSQLVDVNAKLRT